MSYFVFYNSGCDDRWDIEGPLSGAATLRKIEKWRRDEIDVVFHNTFPDLTFSSEDEKARVVIIRGDIILPKAVKVVEKYELP